MRIKKFPTQKLFVVIFLGFIFFLSLNSYFNLKNKIESEGSSFIAKEKVDVLLPVRFIIPKLSIDAPVEYVGITPEGLMDVPKGPNNVAWFNLGTPPGEVGSAVIAGHSGYKNNRPAVFDNLDKLQKGDKISVEDESGTIITFVVRELRTYNPKANPPEVFNSNDGASHLNLVTCTGDWNETARTHSSIF